MENNLHITLTPFRNESRVLKETASLMRSELVQHVYIAALYEDGLKEHEEIDDMRTVWRIRLRSRKWSKRLFIQLIKYLEFFFRVSKYARIKKIKCVNIHHLGLLPLGIFLKFICRAKLVYDAHELETEKNGLTGFRQVLARYVERIFINYADLVIVVGDAINKWYREKYGLTNIITVLNCPEFQEPRKTQRLHDDLNIPKEKKIVIYQGGLVLGRGIEHLLKVFSEQDDQKHVLVCMGYGELESLIREYAQLNSNIYFHEAVAPTEVLKYTASADIGVFFVDNSNLSYYLCLPNKLFEYIMAGLPVIVNNAPEMSRVVNENQIGIVLNELTALSLNRALDDISKMNFKILIQNLRRTAESYSWDNQAPLMISAYKKYVSI